jgi:ribosomal protein S18 acetylase RimI-like enzyme
MAIDLEPMTGVEARDFARASRETYAAAQHDPVTARARAEAAHEAFFHHGEPAPGHHFWNVTADGVQVARVWVGPHPDRVDGAWLYYIEVPESARGRGHGRAALAAVEARLARDGVREMGLNVLTGNEPARHLYSTAGYTETGVAMRKPLG